MVKDRDWLDRSLDYLEEHVERRVTTPDYDKRILELHDRAARKIRKEIRNRLLTSQDKIKMSSMSDVKRKFRQMSLFSLK